MNDVIPLGAGWFWIRSEKRLAKTLNEAAALLGVQPATLRQQIANGKLRAKKVGTVWTVTPGEVSRYQRESRR